MALRLHRNSIVLAVAGMTSLGATPSELAARPGQVRPAPSRQSWRLRELRNFRDAGAAAGLPAGRVFRSDDPRHRPFRACERLQAANIRTIVKLNAFQQKLRPRHRPFWRRGPCGLPELVVSIPYERTQGAFGANIYSLGRRADLSPARRRVVRYIERQVTLTLRELARLKPTQLPVLLHCSLGRDRTGVVLALLELLAGASRGGVERDYVTSAGGAGHTSVVSLRRVLRRLGPPTRFARRELGLSWWEIRQLRRLVRGPRGAAGAGARPAPRPVPFGPP